MMLRKQQVYLFLLLSDFGGGQPINVIQAKLWKSMFKILQKKEAEWWEGKKQILTLYKHPA